MNGTDEAIRELRPSKGASPLRVVYAFDRARNAVLIIGGSKAGVSSDAFYRALISKAEKIWRTYKASTALEK